MAKVKMTVNGRQVAATAKTAPFWCIFIRENLA
jgi:hypothetical protein